MNTHVKNAIRGAGVSVVSDFAGPPVQKQLEKFKVPGAPIVANLGSAVAANYAIGKFTGQCCGLLDAVVFAVIARVGAAAAGKFVPGPTLVKSAVGGAVGGIVGGWVASKV